MRWLIYDSFRASYPLQLCYILTWYYWDFDGKPLSRMQIWSSNSCSNYPPHTRPCTKMRDVPVTFCWGEMLPSASSKQKITSCKRAHCPAGLKFTDICFRVTLPQSLQLQQTLLTLVFCVRMESGQNQNPCPRHVSCNLYLVSTEHVHMHVSKQLCNSDNPFRICVVSKGSDRWSLFATPNLVNLGFTEEASICWTSILLQHCTWTAQ